MAANQGGVYSVLDDERINARADFFAGLGMGIDGSWAPGLGTIVPSNSEIENYNWIGTSPQMSLWEGEAVLRELPNYEATLKNVEYLSGLKIQKADLRRDKTGQIRARVGMLGRRTGTHWETLVSTLIANGETASGTDLRGKAYDGLAFFSASHVYTGSAYTTAQKNLLTASEYPALNVSTSTAPTVAEMADILVRLIGHFFTLKDDQGEPINGSASSFTVMSGTNEIHAAVMGAIGLDTLATGTTNPLAGYLRESGYGITAILNPRLSTKTERIYVFRNDADLRPFILQDEVGVNVSEEDPGVLSKSINVVATATRSAGYGLWQNAIAGVLS